MSEDGAELLREAIENPEDPDEVWQRVKEANKNIEWDYENLLPEVSG